MKTLAPSLLFAASLSVAMPLKTSNTWTWSVTTGGPAPATWVTATVLGSARHDSGTAWTISVRDSAQKTTDTAVALERPNKSQAWLTGSPHLMLELQDRNKHSVAPTPTQPSIIAAPWGAQSFFNDIWKSCKQGSAYVIDASSSTMTNGCAEGAITYPLSRGVWRDTLGPLVFRSFYRPFREWRLLSHNRRSVATDSLLAVPRPPKTGTVLEWEEIQREGSRYGNDGSGKIVHHTWTVTGTTTSPAGAVRVAFRDSSVTDSGLAEAQNVEVALTPETWSSSLWKGSCPTPADAWMREWTDSVTTAGYRRNASWTTAASMGGASGSGYFERIGTNGQMDSVSCSVWTYNVSTFGTFTTRILTAVDGVQVRVPRISSSVAPRSSRFNTSLRALAARYPATMVRWSSANGRRGQFLAHTLSSTNHSLPSGPIFLTAILPNGTAWNASTFVP